MTDMNFGPFKTETRNDGMMMVVFPDGETYPASNVEIFLVQRVKELEEKLNVNSHSGEI